jgi:phosphatidylglycerophosphatase A
MTSEQTSPRSSDLDRLVLALATGLGVGRIPFAPGTFGTLWGFVIAWGLALTGRPLVWQGVALAGIALLGVPVCSRAAKLLGIKDPSAVVYDEFASLPLVFLFVRLNWPNAIAAFLIFRLLDVTKPWPIRRLEHLPGGWGIMADDLAAGLATGAILWLFPPLLAAG